MLKCPSGFQTLYANPTLQSRKGRYPMLTMTAAAWEIFSEQDRNSPELLPWFSFLPKKKEMKCYWKIWRYHWYFPNHVLHSTGEAFLVVLLPKEIWLADNWKRAFSVVTPRPQLWNAVPLGPPSPIIAFLPKSCQNGAASRSHFIKACQPGDFMAGSL